MTIKLLIIVFGSLLSCIGVLLLLLLKHVHSGFKQAKEDFLLKIDSLMTSYATMLNGELNDVIEKAENNKKNILSLKKELEKLKK